MLGKNIGVSTLSSEALASVVMPEGPSVASEPKIELYTGDRRSKTCVHTARYHRQTLTGLRADILSVVHRLHEVLEISRMVKNIVIDGYSGSRSATV